jgi:biotin transporter BioY
MFEVSLRFSAPGILMYIVAIGWIYVVLMMAITEHSVVAGVMTFLLYGVLPLAVILYVIGAPQRRRNRHAEEELRRAPQGLNATSAPPKPDEATKG